MYKNAQYFFSINGDLAGIRVDIDGVTSFVPIDPKNTDYQNIMKLVEDGELTISEPEVTND
jgi:hypothetical protein